MTVTAGTPPADDALLSELRRAATVADPVPGDWPAAASVAFAWSALPEQPAKLAYDSLAGRDRRLGGMQVIGLVLREMRWVAGTRAVELEIDVAVDRVRIIGRATPGRSVAVEALWPEGRRSTETDETGMFRFDELPRRPVCLVVRGDAPFRTGWILS
jgi:hypothetical protein